MSFWRREADGIVVTVRLTPKSSSDSIDSAGLLSDGSEVLKARVRAAPTEGEANWALVALLAKELGVPKSAVEIAGGTTARQKRVRIKGDPALLEGRIVQLARG